MISAIVVASKTAKSLPVFLASIDAYVPTNVEVYIAGSNRKCENHVTHNFENPYDSFGESYNFIVHEAYKNHEHIIVANDDVVMLPWTLRFLEEDIRSVDQETLGWMAARSDSARSQQDIRLLDDNIVYPQEVVAPTLGYVNKKFWQDYLPINWWSDDIQCLDMNKAGAQHYTSRAYVHHVGSLTLMTIQYNPDHRDRKIVEELRHEYAKMWWNA